MDLESLGLGAAVVLFAVAALSIVAIGRRLSAYAERLAECTGMGEAVFGALFLGGTTSISGLTTSITAAATNHPELALSNALGGIAAQTVFLAIADLAFRGANLEHAAASTANLVQGALCSTLLSIVLIGMVGPQWSLLELHPASLGLFAFYVFGMRMVVSARDDPMWIPQRTPETRTDADEGSDAPPRENMAKLWTRFVLAGAVVATAGYVIARTGTVISGRTGLSETLVGTLLTATSTSLPELVTAVAAVRQRAVTLAVGGIIGGNCFDVLFVTFSDAAYRGGSIYAESNEHQVLLVVLSILLTNVLLLGLLRREKHGVAGIGFESFLVLLLYLGFVAILFM